MSIRLSSPDRTSLIRIAASLPAGDQVRRAILSGLSRLGADDKVQVLNENGRKVWVTKETLSGPDKAKYKPIKEEESGGEDVKKKTDAGLKKLNEALDGSGVQLKPKGAERKEIESLLSEGADLDAIVKDINDGEGEPKYEGATKKLHSLLNKMFEG